MEDVVDTGAGYIDKVEKNAEIVINNNVKNLSSTVYTTQSGSLALEPNVVSLCYSGHIRCKKLNILKRKDQLVCAYQRTFRLVNFENTCEIALQNCLYKAQEEKYGIIAKETFFFNGKEKPCEYYLRKANTLSDAVRLYYLDEIKYRKFFDEFEKIDNKNQYNFANIFDMSSR